MSMIDGVRVAAAPVANTFAYRARHVRPPRRLKESIVSYTQAQFNSTVWINLGERKTHAIYDQVNLADCESPWDPQEELRGAIQALLEETVFGLEPAIPFNEQPPSFVTTTLDSHRVNYLSSRKPVFEGARLFCNTRVAVTERLYARGLEGWYPSAALDARRSLGVIADVEGLIFSIRGIMDGILEVGAFPQWWFGDDRMLLIPSDIEERARRLAEIEGAEFEQALGYLLAPLRALYPPWNDEDTQNRIVPMVGSFVARHAIALALFRLLAANEISGALYGTALVAGLFCRFYVLGPSRIAVDIEPETYEAPSEPPAERTALRYSEVLGHADVFKNLRNSLYHNTVHYRPGEDDERVRFNGDGFQRLVNITQAAVVRVGACDPQDCKPLPTPIQDEAAAETIAALEDAGLPYTIAHDILQLSLGNQPTQEDRYPWHPSLPARVYGNARRIGEEMKTLNPFNREERFQLREYLKDHRMQAQKKGEPYAGHQVIEAVVDNLVRMVPVTPNEMDALIEAQVDIDIMRYRNDPFVTDSEMAGWYADVGRKNGLKLDG